MSCVTSFFPWRVVTLVGLFGFAAAGSAQSETEECANDFGIIPDRAALQIIIENHLEWLTDSATGARAELCRLILTDVELEGADLRRAKLEEADLRGANLQGANLEKAHMHRANLTGADLRDANFAESIMRKVNLDGADLSGANLEQANLRKSSAIGSRFDGANLAGANLSKANLERASLIRADLRGASLRKARLRFADIREANLDGANLPQADLTGANFADSSLINSDFEGAVFDATNVSPEQLSRALGVSAAQRNSTVQIPGSAFAEQAVSGEQTSEAEVIPALTDPGEPVVVDAGVDSQADANTAAEQAVVAVVEPAPEPEPPPVVEETASAQPTIKSGGFLVQLGSFRVAETAHNLWGDISDEHSNLFASYVARVKAVDLGADSGKWHRLQVGPFDSKQAAAALCTDYQKVKTESPCIPVVAED